MPISGNMNVCSFQLELLSFSIKKKKNVIYNSEMYNSLIKISKTILLNRK